MGWDVIFCSGIDVKCIAQQRWFLLNKNNNRPLDYVKWGSRFEWTLDFVMQVVRLVFLAVVELKDFENVCGLMNLSGTIVAIVGACLPV